MERILREVVETREAVLTETKTVRRVLPYRGGRGVGPFVFLDHFGPWDTPPGQRNDIGPHPHIGLATVTYLFEGRFLHRDSLGTVQEIRPGEVNWMTAGRGIVHSERTPASLENQRHTVHGLQAWVGLPLAHEDAPPAFDHYPASDLPAFEREGVALRLIAGSAYGQRSPVRAFSDVLYLECRIPAGGTLHYSTPDQAIGFYIVDGALRVDDETQVGPRLLVFANSDRVVVQAERETHGVLLGGAELDGRRHIWWNFVASSRETIEAAKRNWKEGTFAEIPGESGPVPLPE